MKKRITAQNKIASILLTRGRRSKNGKMCRNDDILKTINYLILYMFFFIKDKVSGDFLSFAKEYVAVR